MNDWVEEPKTYDSETITPEEMTELQNNFYPDDIDGGLQNIEVSPEELEIQREKLEYAKTFIDLKESQSAPPYRTDLVHLKLTPEELVVLKQALENLSLDMRTEVPYMSEEMEILNLYDQQSYIRMIRDQVDDTLNEYVKHRPYTPYLVTWRKRIGKSDE